MTESDVVERLQCWPDEPINNVSMLREAAAEIKRLRAEIERLRAALQYYADEEHYREPWANERCLMSRDRGETARRALEGENG